MFAPASLGEISLRHARRSGITALLVGLSAALALSVPGTAAAAPAPEPVSAPSDVIPPPSHAELTFHPQQHTVPLSHAVSTKGVPANTAAPGTQPKAPAPRIPKGIRNPDADLHLKPLVPQKATTRPASGTLQAASSSLGTSFTGLSKSGYSPSDVSAAAGTSDVLESVNESFAIYSKSGTQQYTSTLQNWFKRTASTSVFDPHVTFDPRGSRYAMVADDGTNWLLSVAQQSSGTGSWCNYTLPAISASGQFADYPEIGVDQRYFYLTMIDFKSTSDSTLVDSQIVAVQRSEVESCHPTLHYYRWTQVRDPGTACLLCSQDNLSFHVAPATVQDSLSSDGWLASAYSDGGSHISVFNIDSNNVLHSTQVSVPSYDPPPSAAQPGTSAVLDTGEPDFTNITKTGGELYLALTSKHDWGGGNVKSVVNWMQIDATAGSIGLDKSGSFGDPNAFYFYPSTSGSALPGEYQVFNFAQSGSSTPVSAAIASIDYTGTVTSNVFSLQGQSAVTDPGAQITDNRCSSSPCYRWGDFSSLMIDPSNPGSTMWAAAANAPASDTWSTGITQVNNS
jgi:hypothetical protein